MPKRTKIKVDFIVSLPNGQVLLGGCKLESELEAYEVGRAVALALKKHSKQVAVATGPA